MWLTYSAHRWGEASEAEKLILATRPVWVQTTAVAAKCSWSKLASIAGFICDSCVRQFKDLLGICDQDRKDNDGIAWHCHCLQYVSCNYYCSCGPTICAKLIKLLESACICPRQKFCNNSGWMVGFFQPAAAQDSLIETLSASDAGWWVTWLWFWVSVRHATRWLTSNCFVQALQLPTDHVLKAERVPLGFGFLWHIRVQGCQGNCVFDQPCLSHCLRPISWLRLEGGWKNSRRASCESTSWQTCRQSGGSCPLASFKGVRVL